MERRVMDHEMKRDKDYWKSDQGKTEIDRAYETLQASGEMTEDERRERKDKDRAKL